MTLSTAGMIAAAREAANMTKTQEERDVLNGIANRVEMLAEANSIKSLELNSIREALKIPASDSVQAGTIAAFCKLQSDFEEVTALANRLRRTAKGYQEENQQLRTRLIEAEKAADDLSIHGMWILDNDGHTIIPFGLPVASQLSDELLSAMEEVIRISDRDHEAWDRAKAAISSCRVASGHSSVSGAINDLIAERYRQVSAECWTPEHDDEHDNGELAIVAACYALAAAGAITLKEVSERWPGTWDFYWFKPTTPRRDLVKAGALVIAEIERLDRAKAKDGYA